MENIKPQILEKVGEKKGLPKILWLVPFVSFIIGYFITSYFFSKTDHTTPNLIGKPLSEAIQILSQNHLSMRLLQQRENAALPEGTVLDQIPCPSQKIRAHQSVFVTIAIKPRRRVIPDLWGKKHKEVMSVMAKNNFDVQEFYVHSSYPAGMCIAQSPSALQEIETNQVTLYFSDGGSSLCIMPNFKGALLPDVEKALSAHDIRAEIVHLEMVADGHTCASCKIVDQQPVPGAIVDKSHGLGVQLRVSTI
jgi:beta-lactam-binding protein with PASTA domain